MGKLDSLRTDRPLLFFDLCLLIKKHFDDSVVKLYVYSCCRICSDLLDSCLKSLKAVDLSVGAPCHLAQFDQSGIRLLFAIFNSISEV